MTCSFVCRVAALALSLAMIGNANGQGAVGSFGGRPFVTGFTPVIGRNGAVGGVLIDAAGEVQQADITQENQLRNRWRDLENIEAGIDSRTARETDLRVVSLKRLDRAVEECLDDGQMLTPDMLFLAGIQRVEFVLADPDSYDVLIAGPAGPWRANEAGDVVGINSGVPVLRLDDLVTALRSALTSTDGMITCSIEPTEVGLQRYAKVRARLRTFNERTIRSLELAMGPQQVLVGGIDQQSHFARVLVSSDFVMKRLAMGLDRAPLDDMPSYMDLLRKRSVGMAGSSPRFWMTTNYTDVACTKDRFGWQVRGAAVRTMTEDGVLSQAGFRRVLRDENTVAKQWADAMTDQYVELSSALPVFGKLRDCFDLAVVGSLLAHEGLLVKSGCELQVLTSPSRLPGMRLTAAKTVPSVASYVRGRRGPVISVSGGVEIDTWAVIESARETGKLAPIRSKVLQKHDQRWWW